MKREQLHLIGQDGADSLYAVTHKGLDPRNPAAVLRDWLLTPAGQQFIAESGYVPLPVKKTGK